MPLSGVPALAPRNAVGVRHFVHHQVHDRFARFLSRDSEAGQEDPVTGSVPCRRVVGPGRDQPPRRGQPGSRGIERDFQPL